MLYPFILYEGLIFDGRTIIISLGTLFFGPITGIITVLTTGIYRLILGGIGVVMGVSTIVSSFLIGLIFYRLRNYSKTFSLNNFWLYIMSLLVHVVMVLLVFTLRDDLILSTLTFISSTVLIVYPIVGWFIGRMLLDNEEKIKFREELKESENLFRTTLYSIGDAVITTDLYGKIMHLNQVAETLTGWKESEAVGKRLNEVFIIINENTRIKVESPVEIVLTSKKTVGLANHTLLISKDGKETPIADSGSPIINDNGKIMGVVLVFRDQTEERLKQKQLAESEAYIRTIMENLPIGIAVNSVDPNVNFDYMNENFYKFYGTTREALKEQDSFWEAVYEDPVFREKMKKRVLDDCATGDPQKMIWNDIPIKKGNETRFISARNIPLSEKGLMISTVWDVTQLHKAEEDKIRVEEELEEIFNSTHEAIFVQDASTLKFIDCNNRAIELYGYTTKEELLLSSVVDLSANIHPFTEEVALKHLSDAINISPQTFEWLAKKKNQEIFWIEISLKQTEIKGKKRILAVIRDISDRKKIESALIESEEKFRTLFEESSDAMLLLNNKAFFDCNLAAAHLLGYKNKEELLYLHPAELSPKYQPDGKLSIEKAEAIMMEAYQKGSLVFEWVHKKKNGEPITVEVSLTAITLSGNRILFTLWRDLTQKKHEDLLHSIQYNLAEVFVTTDKLEVLCERVRKEISTIVDTTNFFIALYNPKTKMFTSVVDEDEKDNILTWEAENSLSGLLIKEKKPLLLRKNEIEQLIIRNEISLVGTMPEVWLGFPLKIGKEVLGVMVIQSYDNPNAYSQISFEVIEIIANHLGIYLDKKLSEAKANNLLKAIEQSPVSIIITDKNGIIEYVNPNLLNITGYKLEELIGQHTRIFKSGLVPQEVYKNLWETILSGKDWNGEIQNKKKNGELYWENVTISSVTDDDGSILHFIAVKEDITEKREMMDSVIQSEVLFRSIWETSLDGMRLLDENGTIVDVNNAFCELMESTKEELVGKPYFVFYKNITQSGLLHFKERFISRTIAKHFEAEIELKNGKTLWTELSNSFIEREGSQALLLSIFRDITEKKKIIHELTMAKEKAEEMNKIKSSFFANMSHELRTPLIGILGFSEILKEELADNPDLSNMANTIFNGGNRLLETLNLILNLSKLEANKHDINIKVVDVVAKAKESFNLFSSQAELRGIKYLFQCSKEEILCNVDLNIFNSILSNLLNNAFKFTDKGIIKLSIDSEDNEAKIQISDTGIGIAKDKLDIIWEEFRQASEGLSRQFEGTGLGLTLVRKYVQLLNGRIEVDSKENSGTTFTIFLPLAKETITSVGLPKTEFEQSEELKESNPSIKLLYIEDDPVAVDFVKRILKGYYELDFAVNGIEGEKMAKANKYDGILMDINLKKGDNGVQLTQKLRQLPEYKNKPIIAVTAYASKEDRDEFLSNGLSHYISKPFKRQDFLNFINSIFLQKN